MERRELARPREDKPKPRLRYLFTTFPAATETFNQREVRAMRRLGVEVETYSLWGGGKTFDGIPVQRFRLMELWHLLHALPYWGWRRPWALIQTLQECYRRPLPSLQNWAENFLGFGFAIVRARHFERHPSDLLHGPWATMPGAACLLINRLTGPPFSMGAHAYDIYQHGGDWLLREKLLAASLVHTSTDAAADRVAAVLNTAENRVVIDRALSEKPHARARGGSSEIAVRPATARKIIRIRRGLTRFPAFNGFGPRRGRALQLLSVGRLTPKKGYFFQLRVYRTLLDQGIPFHAEIVGGGKLYTALKREIRIRGLNDHVILVGPMDEDSTQARFASADIFLFTGRPARDGDRDGLPNVIAEAMAHGCLVCTTPSAGALEAITHRQTGLVLPFEDPSAWASALKQIYQEPHAYTPLAHRARGWVEDEFDAEKNARRLITAMETAAAQAR